MKLATPLLVAGLVLLAGCAAPLQTGSNESADGGPTIAVSGTGTASAESDLAVVHLGVETTAESADEARGTVADDVASVRGALDDAGVPASNVTTTVVSSATARSTPWPSRSLRPAPAT